MVSNATKIKEEIKASYAKIRDKAAIKIAIANKYGVEPPTVGNHWFGSLTAVPKKHREAVLEDLKKAIEQQHSVEHEN